MGERAMSSPPGSPSSGGGMTPGVQGIDTMGRFQITDDNTRTGPDHKRHRRRLAQNGTLNLRRLNMTDSYRLAAAVLAETSMKGVNVIAWPHTVRMCFVHVIVFVDLILNTSFDSNVKSNLEVAIVMIAQIVLNIAMVLVLYFFFKATFVFHAGLLGNL